MQRKLAQAFWGGGEGGGIRDICLYVQIVILNVFVF